MTTTNVITKIGQFQQPSATAVFAAVSADAIYVNGVSITSSSTGGGGGAGSITGGANTGSGVGIYSFTGDANLVFKSLSAGLNTMVRDDSSYITIGELSGVDINFVGISGTTVTVNGNTVTIDGSGTAGSGGGIASISGLNLLLTGSGTAGVFAFANGGTGYYKSLVAQGGVTIIESVSSITISSSTTGSAAPAAGGNTVISWLGL